MRRGDGKDDRRYQRVIGQGEMCNVTSLCIY